MNIAENLELLATTKENIRVAINNRGGSLETSTPFSAYPEAISSVGANDLIDLIEGDARSINIPSGTTAIAPSKFQNMASLSAVTIPDTVTSIGQSAFNGCTSLRSVDIPGSVTMVDTRAFYGDSGLQSVTFGDGVVTINTFAFSGCSSLSGDVVFPDSVTTISGSAFNECSSITGVTIGSGITTIASSAFAYCSALQDVYVYATTPPTLGSGAFSNAGGAYGLHAIYVPAASVNAYKAASGWSDYANKIQAIPVPTVNSALYDIGDNLIDECDVTGLTLMSFSNLTTNDIDRIHKLVVGSNVVEISDFPDFNTLPNLEILDFYSATALTTIGESAFGYSSGNYEKRSDPESEYAVVEIPEGVTTIGQAAFYMGGINNLDLPSTITDLDQMSIDIYGVVALRATTPPNRIDSALDSGGMFTLYVPDAAVSDYEQALPNAMPGAIQGLSDLQWINE